MSKPKAQLVAELAELRRRVDQLEGDRERGPGRGSPARPAGQPILVENAAFGHCICSAEDAFVTVNPALVEMLGYDSDQALLAVKPSALYAEAAERKRWLKVLEGTERIEAVEVKWTRKDGSTITARISGCCLRRKDRSLEGFELLVEDLTHQRRLEEQLRQAQKMEAVGHLTGGIAHDFNNILSVILSNQELIREGLPSEFASLHAELDDLKAAVERGASMIRKLLGFSRSGDLRFQDLDPRTLVQEMAGIFQRLLPDNITVETSLDERVGVIHADRGAIEQVLMNLATNARDAMPRGGHLRFQVGRPHLTEAFTVAHPWMKHGDYACISVTDDGIGMDKKTQQSIFEPFFTTKSPDAGTGLGMSMVYGLVKQHGGSVHVYSEVGQGTVVKLYFPVVGKELRPSRRCVSYESKALAGSATILLAEDETTLRRAAKRVLESQGYMVLVAADGEEALSILGSYSSDIHLVISDLVMPRLGGADLYRAVKERHPSVRFILTSGFSGTEVKKRNGVDPGIPWIQKPWSVPDLLWAVHDALSGEATAPST